MIIYPLVAGVITGFLLFCGDLPSPAAYSYLATAVENIKNTDVGNSKTNSRWAGRYDLSVSSSYKGPIGSTTEPSKDPSGTGYVGEGVLTADYSQPESGFGRVTFAMTAVRATSTLAKVQATPSCL